MKRFEGKKIGLGLTGSFCTLDKTLTAVETLLGEGAELIPILSYSVNLWDTKFGTSQSWKDRLHQMGCPEPVVTIPGAEPFGPTTPLDVMLVAPCSGNSLAKMAHGITDTPVLMAAKAQLRNSRPLILAISSNDGLSANAANIGLLLGRKNVYLVPFWQDDCHKKPHSLLADMSLIADTTACALAGKQIQPLVLQK